MKCWYKEVWEDWTLLREIFVSSSNKKIKLDESGTIKIFRLLLSPKFATS